VGPTSVFHAALADTRLVRRRRLSCRGDLNFARVQDPPAGVGVTPPPARTATVAAGPQAALTVGSASPDIVAVQARHAAAPASDRATMPLL
jgi:hypothetical protein